MSCDEIEDKEITNNSDDNPSQINTKTNKKGIIYLSSIPPYMNVTRIRETFGEFGTVGRVFLQLNNYDNKQENGKSKKKNVAKKFTEGWVEFEKKRDAKKVALHLNNKQVNSRKKSKHYDCIWNIKYLSNFKWTHLNERLAYEQVVRKQKLRAEITIAKKKTNFFTSNLSKHKNKDSTSAENKSSVKSNSKVTVEANNDDGREDFLKSLFK